MSVCIVIPSYNEEKTIGGIVSKLKDRSYDVLVVDDGSLDDTAKIAARAGAVVISHVRNLGKGASIKEAFKYILRSTNYNTIVLMDGDGQHHPDDVDVFIKHAEANNDDIVIGNRMFDTKKMPASRFLTNKITSRLLSVLCKQRIPDTQCGFRLLRRKTLESLHLTSTKYDLESEMLINASRKNLKIASIPIKTIYGGERSQIHPVKDSLRFIALLLRSFFTKT